VGLNRHSYWKLHRWLYLIEHLKNEDICHRIRTTKLYLTMTPFLPGTVMLTPHNSRVQLKCDGTRWRTWGEVKGKLANGVGSQYPSHYLETSCIQHYLLPLLRTTRLPVVDWTGAPADLNWLVRFAERRNLVSARVPSHFKRSIPIYADVTRAGLYRQCTLPRKGLVFMNHASMNAWSVTRYSVITYKFTDAYSTVAVCSQEPRAWLSRDHARVITDPCHAPLAFQSKFCFPRSHVSTKILHFSNGVSNL
jgi:hypothetical protein